MDASYWKARCEAAESALERARSALQLHAVRKNVIAALGDLQPGQYIPTGKLAAQLGWNRHKVIYILGGMHRVGLVDRTPATRCGGRGNSVRWKLGHMVQVEMSE